MILREIGEKYGTDKVVHGFCDIYDKYFSAEREKVKNILEIGVFFGSSILMWREYFPNATVWGIDSFEGVQGNKQSFKDADKFYNAWKEHNYSSISLRKIDQGSESQLKIFRDEIEREEIKFDIIIDDGSHLMRDQQITLGYLQCLVNPKGFYVIEDTHSSLEAGYDVENGNSTLDMLNKYMAAGVMRSKYIDVSVLEERIDFIKHEHLLHGNPVPWQNTSVFREWYDENITDDKGHEHCSVSLTSIIQFN
ncbi:hypothetical protein MNBD_GAMMA15-2494 [hydrothermal vent metagenome]|uniref:Class I SAM-dependent methyltransferase n=1 Tax=hydrothermal vent metagenome TaxID=652676 RepID=A0A3B0Y4Z0_9ZZZZ